MKEELPDVDIREVMHLNDEGGEYEVRGGRVLKWMSANEFLSRAMEAELANDAMVKRHLAFKQMMETR